MTRKTYGKAIATATAAITTIALGATTAGAAQLGPANFAGAAKAQTLQLSIDAPAEVMGLLGQGSRVIDLGISLTEVTSSSTNALFASTDLVTGTLASVVPTGGSSDVDGDTHSDQFLGLEQGPISLGVGTTSYNVDRATRAVTSTSELAHVGISVDSVLSGAVLPAKDVLNQVETVVDTVTSEADALVGGIVGEINAIVDELEDTLEEAAGLVVDIPAVNVKDLNVIADLRSTNILDIKKLWSETSVMPVGNMVESRAKSGILGLSILEGLVEIPEWTFEAWAKTAGTAGTAEWGGEVKSLAVKLQGTEIISLDGGMLTVGGVELDLNNPSLSGIVGEEIGSELDALIGDLLDLTGLSVEQGKLTGSAAEDGSTATATVTPFSLSLAPLHAATALTELTGLTDAISGLGLSSADELFRIQLDLLPVTATASATPAAAPEAPPATPNLPRTGGGAAAMALGLLGMGSAGILRRRF